jgi:hypothetical protein
VKPAALIGIAFVVGLAGSTVVGMKRAPAPPPADSAPARPATVAAPHDTVTPKPDTTAVPDAINAETPHDSTVAVRSDSVQLAQTFAKLDPREVALLGSHLTDADFSAALRGMGVSRSAAVLAELPKARAATISKLLLSPTAK